MNEWIPAPRVHRYRIDGQWEILVGRTASDNDILSLKTAAGHDLWFHVHGMPGSHVILRVPSDEMPPAEVIRKVAGLAVWYSKARTAGLVPVVWTRARNVSKRSGMKPGQVRVQSETKVKVRPLDPQTEPSIEVLEG